MKNQIRREHGEIKKETEKAVFFSTVGGEFDFWCPKSLIKDQGSDDEYGFYIEIPEWFFMKTLIASKI